MTHTKILISGSRVLYDPYIKSDLRDLLSFIQAKHGRDDLVIIHGDCPKGIDSHVKEYCSNVGITQICYPANWSRFGRAAGHIRNEFMLEDSKPAHVYCIFGDINNMSPGTKGMFNLCKEKGVPVTILDAGTLADIDLTI